MFGQSLKRNGLTQPGPVRDGQPVSARYLNDVASDSIQQIVAGPGIRVQQSGRKVAISATPQRGGGGGGGGGSSRTHCVVFPAIPLVVTDIELGGMYWHACDPDTVWTLDSFVFTAATGVVGTDVTGA